MIANFDKLHCCGCNACADACSVDAITFVANDEGFLYPSFDQSKCTNCGTCGLVCPLNNLEKVQGALFKQKRFVAVHKNLSTRFASSSGGVFTALANAVYRRGGCVGGAVWTNDFGVQHIISDNPLDLLKIRGAKYIQSDLQGFYRRIAQLLSAGRPVLVCGTPCQMLAVQSYFGSISDNLFLVDFDCSGNGSPMVLKKYLEWQEQKAGSKINAIHFNNKEFGRRRSVDKYIFKNGKVIYEPRNSSLFSRMFFGTFQFCRPSCSVCKFQPSQCGSDLTLADCLGFTDEMTASLDQDLGMSDVRINSERGARLWEWALGSLRFYDLPLNGKENKHAVGVAQPMMHGFSRADIFKSVHADGIEGLNKLLGTHSTSSDESFFIRVRHYLGRLRRIVARANAFGSWRFIFDNKWIDIIKGRPIVFTRSDVHWDVRGRLSLVDDVYFGKGFHKRAPLITAVHVAPGGCLSFGGSATISYGADIEVLDGASLTIGEGAVFNLGATIICGCKINIGRGVALGRHITIRDNNGGHFTNLPGYKNDAPIEIGDHVWICEGATILPGVRIGSGAIIGAKAVVSSNVPANTLATGNPAKVVAEGVEWKD